MSNDGMHEIAQPCTTISDKIRALDAAGFARADIARFLGKRYQHVRNVLVDGAPRKSRYSVGRREMASVQEGSSQSFANAGAAIVRLPIGADGTLQLTPAILRALGLATGGVAIAELQDDRLIVLSVGEAIARAQAMVRQWIPGNHSLVDSLIADRRREAEAEARSND